MADNKNPEVAPVEAASPVTTATPVTIVRERRSWLVPLVSALAIALALVVGGIGGFAIGRATDHREGRVAMEQAHFPGGPGAQQGQQGGQGGQGGQQSRPPHRGEGKQNGMPGRPGNTGNTNPGGPVDPAPAPTP
ncbi:MAG: hypothetical protein ABIR17_05615 [Pseudolysinimonas sp.]|uniref:hypothetical protein n=1 Tax=Pseudolysinimonas sp. TaxID=2680009 RepID=UPI003263FE93